MSIILYSLCAADRRRHYSPHVWKIIMALKHKELQAEVRPVSFAEIAGIEDGSYKSVPVLNDNGHIEGDSFEIAVHLERAYPDRPSLFGGPGGQAMARFVESFSQTVIHPPVSAIAAMDMHALMSPADQAYFRAAREKRFGKTLEEASATRHIELAALPENSRRCAACWPSSRGWAARNPCLPTTSCSACCSGLASPCQRRCCRSTIPSAPGSSAASTCTAPSGAPSSCRTDGRRICQGRPRGPFPFIDQQG
ncbi:Beta-aryl ether cleaving enzyme [Janthinobacterium lividum]|nr:glutathione S-transferase N-terminal domain-containing protein [Janthinobacterium lividum]STR27504.1 Beta-aryl ether cleaving enzyme [Janthinobacterium lividum]